MAWTALTILLASAWIGGAIGEAQKKSDCGLFTGEKVVNEVTLTFDYYKYIPTANIPAEIKATPKALTDFKRSHLPPQLWCKQLSGSPAQIITWVCVQDQLLWAEHECVDLQCSVQMVTDGGLFKGFRHDCSVTVDAKNYIDDNDPAKCPDYAIPTGPLPSRMEMAYAGFPNQPSGVLQLNTPFLQTYRCAFRKSGGPYKSSGYSQLVCANSASAVPSCVKKSCRVKVVDRSALAVGTKPDNPDRQLQLDCNHPTADPDFSQADTGIGLPVQTGPAIGNGIKKSFSCLSPWLVSVDQPNVDPTPYLEYYHFGKGYLYASGGEKADQNQIKDHHGPKRYLKADVDDISTLFYCTPGYEHSLNEVQDDQKPDVWWCVYDAREWPPCVDQVCTFRKATVNDAKMFVPVCGLLTKDLVVNQLSRDCDYDYHFTPGTPPPNAWTAINYLEKTSDDFAMARADVNFDDTVKDLEPYFCQYRPELGLKNHAPHRRLVCWKKDQLDDNCHFGHMCTVKKSTQAIEGLKSHFDMSCSVHR